MLSQKMLKALYEQGEKVVPRVIEKPPSEFGTPMEMFQATLKHEQFITSSIHELVTLALEEKDYAT